MYLKEDEWEQRLVSYVGALKQIGVGDDGINAIHINAIIVIEQIKDVLVLAHPDQPLYEYCDCSWTELLALPEDILSPLVEISGSLKGFDKEHLFDMYNAMYYNAAHNVNIFPYKFHTDVNFSAIFGTTLGLHQV